MSGKPLLNADNSNVNIEVSLGGKLYALLVALALVLVANFYVLGRNMAKQSQIEESLRANTVATDLAKYNAQEVRIQAEVNKHLQQALLATGCVSSERK